MRIFKVIVALLLVAAAGRAPGQQDTGPPRETVVYSSIQPGNWDLYLFERPVRTRAG